MLTVGLFVVTLLVIFCTKWINKWRKPKCTGVLPPGSMGWPLIGETLQLIVPSYSLDLPLFIKTRVQRFGPIFRTCFAGKPVIISTDSEFNHYILQNEGKLVEFLYLDSLSKLFQQDNRVHEIGYVHKYLRSTILNHFGTESLKTKLLPQLEEMANEALRFWSSKQTAIDVLPALSAMLFEFAADHMFGYKENEHASKSLSADHFTLVLEGLISFPLNIPGTTFHKCLQNQKKAIKTLRDILKNRRTSCESRRGDFLDQMIDNLDKESFVTEDFIVHILYGLIIATTESVGRAMTLTFKLLAENPSVLQELTVEHEKILKSRESTNSALTWSEYKSMTFTLQVINETLRLNNPFPGMLRRTLKDIQLQGGYTIPSGWTLLLVTPALHMNPDVFNDPIAFNPWRWKELDSYSVSKNFMPFGLGMRQCAGAEFTRVCLATFLHVLVTKYRWTIVKRGAIARIPTISFGDGIHIKFSERCN